MIGAVLERKRPVPTEPAKVEKRLRPGRLEGKVAVVVGAGCSGPGWGNGRATAVIFANEGARVFAVDHKAASLEETRARAEYAGGDIRTHVGDATNAPQVAAMVDACIAAYGRDRYPGQQCGRLAYRWRGGAVGRRLEPTD